MNPPLRVDVRTGEYRLDFLARREHVGTYRYAPGTIPGFSFLSAPEGRAIITTNAESGQGLWIAHGSVGNVAFGVGAEDTKAPAREAGAFDLSVPQVGQIVSTSVMARRGSVSAGFQQECAWLDADGKLRLRDQRTFRMLPGPSAGTILDITLRLFAPDNQPVTLGRDDKTLLRLQTASYLLPSGGGQMRNSQDDYGSEEMNGRSAAWCACVGVTRGETVGCVLLDHPDNRWHPPRWTVQASGLVAPQSFAWSALELSPFEPLQLRYRLYIHEGYVDAGWCAARLAEFAVEPVRT